MRIFTPEEIAAEHASLERERAARHAKIENAAKARQATIDAAFAENGGVFVTYKGEHRLTPIVRNGQIAFAEIPDALLRPFAGGKQWDYLETTDDLDAEGSPFGYSRNQKRAIRLSESDGKKIESMVTKAKQRQMSNAPAYRFRLTCTYYRYFAAFENESERPRNFNNDFDAVRVFGQDVITAWHSEELNKEFLFTAKLFTNRKGAFCVDVRSVKRTFLTN